MATREKKKTFLRLNNILMVLDLSNEYLRIGVACYCCVFELNILTYLVPGHALNSIEIMRVEVVHPHRFGDSPSSMSEKAVGCQSISNKRIEVTMNLFPTAPPISNSTYTPNPQMH